MKSKRFYFPLLVSVMLAAMMLVGLTACTDNTDNPAPTPEENGTVIEQPTEDVVTRVFNQPVALLGAQSELAELLIKRCENLKDAIDDNTKVVLLNSEAIGSLPAETKQALREAYDRNAFIIVFKPLKEIVNNFFKDIEKDEEEDVDENDTNRILLAFDKYDVVGFNKHGDRLFLEKLFEPGTHINSFIEEDENGNVSSFNEEVNNTPPTNYTKGQCVEAVVDLLKKLYERPAATRNGNSENKEYVLTFLKTWKLDEEEWLKATYPEAEAVLTTTVYIESAFNFSLEDPTKGDDYYCIKVNSSFPANKFFLKDSEYVGGGLYYTHWGYTAIDHKSTFTWAANQGKMEMLESSPQTSREQGEVSTTTGFDIELTGHGGWSQDGGAEASGEFAFGYNHSETESWSISDVTLLREDDPHEETNSASDYAWHYKLTEPYFNNDGSRGKICHMPPIGRSTINYTQSMLIRVKDSRDNESDMTITDTVYNKIRKLAHQLCFATKSDNKKDQEFKYLVSVNLKKYHPCRSVGHYRVICNNIANYAEYETVKRGLSDNSITFKEMLDTNYFLNAKTQKKLKAKVNEEWDGVCDRLKSVTLPYVNNTYRFQLYDENKAQPACSKVLVVNSGGTITIEE